MQLALLSRWLALSPVLIAVSVGTGRGVHEMEDEDWETAEEDEEHFGCFSPNLKTHSITFTAMLVALIPWVAVKFMLSINVSM